MSKEVSKLFRIAEYGMGEEVSTEADMYSYGIMLLEMFTGTRPTDSTFIDNFSLHNYVKFALPSRVMEIVDSTIIHEEVEANNARLVVSKNQWVQHLLVSEIAIYLKNNSFHGTMPQEILYA
ncbi:hypothetical protein RJ640_003029 [Escallonia rubra]|uniref:Protein kinase domain-containing protein n=1 Tax=Escallonia rubra TaxID=112253 RepID=A0AA88QZJ0_9ASTE|nr:hypothetical protein RJ640_003029 [Escallonia rubra]